MYHVITQALRHERHGNHDPANRYLPIVTYHMSSTSDDDEDIDRVVLMSS